MGKKPGNVIRLLLIIAAFWATSFARAEVQLEAVNAYSMGDVFYTELNFNEPVKKEDVKIEFINRTIQVDVPGVKWAKEPFSRAVSHDRVKSVYTYMPMPSTARARIIQKKPFKAEELLGHVELEEQGNRVLVKVFNPTMNVPAVTLPEKKLPRIKPIDIGSVLDKDGFVKPRKEKPTKISDAANRLAEEVKFRKDPAVEEQERLAKTIDEAIEKPKEQAEKILGTEASTKESDVKKSITVDPEKDAPESEIPLFSASTEAKGAISEEATWSRLLMSLAFIAVFATAMTLFTRWWSRRKTKSLDNNSVRVLTRHHIGPKRELLIVQIAGESLLLGVTDQSINMIKTLSLFDEEIPQVAGQNKFADALAGQLTDVERDVTTTRPASLLNGMDDVNFQEPKEAEEEFAVSQVQDIVAARLKNMRSF